MQTRKQEKSKTKKDNEELEKLTKRKGLSLETKAKINHTLIFPIAMYECEKVDNEKADKEKKDSFEIQHWGIVLQIPCVTRKMKKWVIVKIEH